MALVQSGSLRLFRVFGIDVMIHWSWLLIAVIEMQFHPFGNFQSPWWVVALYLSIFGIVSLHELGHLVACRKLGGTADRIMLAPWGGKAVYHPPPRPGPWFFTVAAGPFVNVMLVPATFALAVFCHIEGWAQQSLDLQSYLGAIIGINLFLLVINLLPLYPNDGGQMVFAILWSIIGRWPALLMTSLVGLVGSIAIGVLCLLAQQGLLTFVSAMLILGSLGAFLQARKMMRIMNIPRHHDASCPACGAHPIRGGHWVCDECRFRFDTFETLAECPKCYKRFPETLCIECGGKHSIIAWFPRYTPSSQPLPTEPPQEAATRPLLGPYRPTD